MCENFYKKDVNLWQYCFKDEVRRLLRQTNAPIPHIPTTSIAECPPGKIS